MKYGLKKKDLEVILAILRDYPGLKEAVLFGSRAKETYKQGSDIDLALKGDHLSDICWELRGRLNEESSLPYFFDVLIYKKLTNKALLEHIDRVGQVIYTKS